MTPEPVQIAVFARAPVPGQAKTRLIPALGPARAARLHRQLSLRAVDVALAAEVGPVSLWCAPSPDHRFFQALARHRGLACERQCGDDLGARMADCLARLTRRGPAMIIGTDCPALTAGDLREAAAALRDGPPAVLTPAEDGGYVLVGLRAPLPEIFRGIAWGTDTVMATTRNRLASLGVRWHETPTRWDVDRPEDLRRLAALSEFA